MAIYYLDIKTVSRGSSTSAGSRCDYINKENKYAKNSDEVLYKESGNMPLWAENNSKEYWSSADSFERANARLFKQIIVALPNELNSEEQIDLIKNFTNKITSTKGGNLPFSFAIHKGFNSEQKNPHAHIMISERVNDGLNRDHETWFKRANKKEPEKGGALKSLALRPKEWLLETRMEWANQTNLALEKGGYKERIDHRTLKAQGINRKPTRHRGVALNAMLKLEKITLAQVRKPLENKISEEEKNLISSIENLNLYKKAKEDMSKTKEEDKLKYLNFQQKVLQGKEEARKNNEIFKRNEDERIKKEIELKNSLEAQKTKEFQEYQRLLALKKQAEIEKAVKIQKNLEKTKEEEKQKLAKESIKSHGKGLSR